MHCVPRLRSCPNLLRGPFPRTQSQIIKRKKKRQKQEAIPFATSPSSILKLVLPTHFPPCFVAVHFPCWVGWQPQIDEPLPRLPWPQLLLLQFTVHPQSTSAARLRSDGERYHLDTCRLSGQKRRFKPRSKRKRSVPCPRGTIHTHTSQEGREREMSIPHTYTRYLPLISIWLNFGVIWVEANACFLHPLLHERLADVGLLHSSPAPTMSSCSKFSSGPGDLASADADNCSFCFKQRVLIKGSSICRKLYSG